MNAVPIGLPWLKEYACTFGTGIVVLALTYLLQDLVKEYPPEGGI